MAPHDYNTIQHKTKDISRLTIILSNSMKCYSRTVGCTDETFMKNVFKSLFRDNIQICARNFMRHFYHDECIQSVLL